MNNELGKQVYRKLIYFNENEIPIHFCLNSGGWKNGKIKSLDKKELTFVLDEFVEGELLFLCEEIDIDSINKFKEKKDE